MTNSQGPKGLPGQPGQSDGTDHLTGAGPQIDNDLGKFPGHMGLARDVFSFSHDEAARAAERFSNVTEFLTALDQVLGAIASSELPEESKSALLQLLQEEKDVISFSLASRTTVVAM